MIFIVRQFVTINGISVVCLHLLPNRKEPGCMMSAMHPRCKLGKSFLVICCFGLLALPSVFVPAKCLKLACAVVPPLKTCPLCC